jgi:hypothetical protein
LDQDVSQRCGQLRKVAGRICVQRDTAQLHRSRCILVGDRARSFRFGDVVSGAKPVRSWQDINRRSRAPLRNVRFRIQYRLPEKSTGEWAFCASTYLKKEISFKRKLRSPQLRSGGLPCRVSPPISIISSTRYHFSSDLPRLLTRGSKVWSSKYPINGLLPNFLHCFANIDWSSL